MELEVKKAFELEEGKHQGTISKIGRRLEPFDYSDVFIKVDGTELEIKYGCPTNLSLKSKLGRLIGQFIELKEGEKVDINQILENKRVQFMTINETKEGMTFARVVEDSIKPLKEEASQ